MSIPFFKYHGTGNDFIMIDERELVYPTLSEERIAFLCDRHFGIGADGLIRIRKSAKADFEMLYYNADGKEGSMCGNGGRCAVAFAYALKHVGKQATFLASDGLHSAEIISEEPVEVKLKMSDVGKVEELGNDFFIHTGSPHFVRMVNDPDQVDVCQEGKKIRYDDKFAPGGTNVNFVKVENGTLRIRTYERGVEDETLSCGTGIVGSVLSLVYSKKLAGTSPVNVHARGGKLKVYFRLDGSVFTDVYLEGPATAVFRGEIR